MFVFIVILALSGLIIEIGEAIAGAIYENESQVPAAALFFMGVVTAAHVLSGICFALLSVFHVKKNWGAMKNHIKAKNGKVGKEVLFACALTAAVLILAFLAKLLIG
jgi:hypothetical protein